MLALVGVANQYLTSLESQPQEAASGLYCLNGQKTDCIVQSPRLEPNVTGKERNKERKRRNKKKSQEIKPSEMDPTDVGYTPRFVPCLVVNRKFSSGSRWKQVPRLTDRHYVERICVGGFH